MPHPSRTFRIAPGQRVDIGALPTAVPDLYDGRSDYRTQLTRSSERLQALQNLLYADNRQAILLIFQAMDTAGKDGAIRHVMSGVNPQGCQVFSFRAPSAEELDHDFLWRAARALPERGRIGIFNRSYYEETLVVRVHPALLDAQHLPPRAGGLPSLWRERFEAINAFERHLVRSGTRIIKFFLHLSKEEQRQRLLERLDDPEKNWKFAPGDVEERNHWEAYQAAYQDVLRHTSTADAPWYAIPADDKKNARLLVADAIIDAMQEMALEFPAPAEGLAAMRAILEAEAKTGKKKRRRAPAS